jgi:hypothetical protein
MAWNHVDKAVCLKSHCGNNLQNEFFWENARCSNQNTDAWEQMVLLPTVDGKITIQSRWNNKNLQVQPCGKCVFANTNQELWEKFDMTEDDCGNVFFRSCHTGKFLQCNAERFVVCTNETPSDWEAWHIIFPQSTDMLTSKQLLDRSIVASCVVGGALLPIAGGLAATSLVPIAMAEFGTVIAGVGTIHASFAAGGVAATLQVASATLLTGEAVAASGAVSGALSAAWLYVTSKPTTPPQSCDQQK